MKSERIINKAKVTGETPGGDPVEDDDEDDTPKKVKTPKNEVPTTGELSVLNYGFVIIGFAIALVVIKRKAKENE